MLSIRTVSAEASTVSSSRSTNRETRLTGVFASSYTQPFLTHV